MRAATERSPGPVGAGCVVRSSGAASRAPGTTVEVFCERALLWLEDEIEGPVHCLTDAGKARRSSSVTSAGRSTRPGSRTA
jgi:hypothetical protein